jgi:hypothetical protein
MKTSDLKVSRFYAGKTKGRLLLGFHNGPAPKFTELVSFEEVGCEGVIRVITAASFARWAVKEVRLPLTDVLEL